MQATGHMLNFRRKNNTIRFCCSSIHNRQCRSKRKVR